MMKLFRGAGNVAAVVFFFFLSLGMIAVGWWLALVGFLVLFGAH